MKEERTCMKRCGVCAANYHHEMVANHYNLLATDLKILGDLSICGCRSEGKALTLASAGL